MPQRWQQHLPTLCLALFSLVVMGAGIWSSSVLTQGDESDYIRSSQEMFADGDLLTPTLRGEPRFTKPPLLYWMAVASYRLFGVSLFSARLPIVLCGILAIVYVYRLGLLLFDRNAALISALLTSTAFGMIKFSKIVLMEVPLTLTMLAASFYFARYFRGNRHSDLLASFFCVGLSSLLKSPVYSAISVMVFVLFLLSAGGLRQVISWRLVAAVVLALVVAVPWYAAMMVLHGSAFSDFYYNEHYIKFLYVNHYLFRVWVGLLLYLLPWTLYFIWALVRVFVERLYRTWPYKFLLINLFVFLCVFLVPHQKGLYYAIPAIPYGGLLAGAMLSNRAPGRVWDMATAVLLLAISGVLLAAILLLDVGALSALMAGGLIAASAIALLRDQHRRGAAFIFYGLALVPFYVGILPSVNLPVIPVADARSIIKDRPLYSYALSPLRFADALDRSVVELTEPEQLSQVLEEGAAVIVIGTAFDSLEPELRRATSVRLQWHRWRRRLRLSEVIDALLQHRPQRIQEPVYLLTAKE